MNIQIFVLTIIVIQASQTQKMNVSYLNTIFFYYSKLIQKMLTVDYFNRSAMQYDIHIGEPDRIMLQKIQVLDLC